MCKVNIGGHCHQRCCSVCLIQGQHRVCKPRKQLHAASLTCCKAGIEVTGSSAAVVGVQRDAISGQRAMYWSSDSGALAPAGNGLEE